jgi:hypothetical protein
MTEIEHVCTQLIDALRVAVDAAGSLPQARTAPNSASDAIDEALDQQQALESYMTLCKPQTHADVLALISLANVRLDLILDSAMPQPQLVAEIRAIRRCIQASRSFMAQRTTPLMAQLIAFQHGPANARVEKASEWPRAVTAEG